MIRIRGAARAKRLLSTAVQRSFPKWRVERDIRSTYKSFFGHELEDAPETFTGKIYSRMINEVRDPNPLLSVLADKHKARQVVGRLIGDDYLIPVIWSGSNPAKIPFSSLPEKSIAKVTHGSGSNIVLTGSQDPKHIILRLRDYLSTSHYWHWREYWYYPIRGRVQIEQFLDDGYSNGPLDYRFWCFDGEPAVVQADDCKHGINPFYDMKWNKIPLKYRSEAQEAEIKKPEGFERMTALARTLSAGFGFVRVDFFNIHGKIYFGEMTFAPVAGQIKFDPKSWDIRLGALWNKADPRSVSEWRSHQGQIIC